MTYHKQSRSACAHSGGLKLPNTKYLALFVDGQVVCTPSYTRNGNLITKTIFKLSIYFYTSMKTYTLHQLVFYGLSDSYLNFLRVTIATGMIGSCDVAW